MVCICIISIIASYAYHCHMNTTNNKPTIGNTHFAINYFCFSIIYSLVCAYFERYTSFSSAACSTWYDIRYTMRSKRLLLCYDDHHNMRRIKAKQDIQLLLLNKCDSGKTLPVLCSDNWYSFAWSCQMTNDRFARLYSISRTHSEHLVPSMVGKYLNRAQRTQYSFHSSFAHDPLMEKVIESLGTKTRTSHGPVISAW